MHSSLLIVLWVLFSFVIFKAYIFISNEIRHRRNARRLGCGIPPWVMPQDPLGISNIRKMLAADRELRMGPHVHNVAMTAMEKNGPQFGTFRQNILGGRFLFTVDPKIIQTVLAHQFKDFGLGEIRHNNFRPLLGDGIFGADGKQWEHSRALLRPQFVREQVSDLDLEERHVQNMLRALPIRENGWTDVNDLKTLFFRLTLDTATEFLYGQSVHTQLADLPGQSRAEYAIGNDAREFADAFDAAQQAIAESTRYGNMYWLGHNAKYKEDCRRCHNFIDRYVQQAIVRVKSGEKKTSNNGKPVYVFLDALAETTSNPVELRQEVLNILLAGRDTTAGLLSFLFMSLEQHPGVFKKLREIVLEEFGTYRNPKEITFSGLKSCNYLQWVLHETLRLYPIVPIDSRRALTDTTLPTGGGPDGRSPIYVREGTQVDYCVYSMHRRKDLWGPDADDFRPERWDGRRHGWEYLPFNGGPRICIGQQFALTEAGYVTVRLLQRFESIEGVGNTWEPVEKGGLGWNRLYLALTMSPADGVKLRLKEASE